MAHNNQPNRFFNTNFFSFHPNRKDEIVSERSEANCPSCRQRQAILDRGRYEEAGHSGGRQRRRIWLLYCSGRVSDSSQTFNSAARHQHSGQFKKKSTFIFIVFNKLGKKCFAGGKSLLESWVTTFLPDWELPFIFVRFMTNFFFMCSNSMVSAHMILK